MHIIDKNAKAKAAMFSTAFTFPKNVFDDQLYFIPAPILDSTKEHFSKFKEVYGSVPT